MKLTRAVSGDALVLEGVRIPDPDDGGRREIDMVIATKDEIIFVEQKHWSGSFTITSEGRFFQRRKNGGTLMHKDIVAWTCRKGDLLCNLHERRVGEAAPPSRVVLVFSNKNLEWDPLPKDVPAEASALLENGVKLSRESLPILGTDACADRNMQLLITQPGCASGELFATKPSAARADRGIALARGCAAVYAVPPASVAAQAC